MKLYFLRHGSAADFDVWDGTDFDRPLTRDGRERMEREAKAMAALAFPLDLIVSSPLVRAKQTAAIVAAALGLSGRLIVDERLALDFGPAPLASLLADHRSARALMLVGHEPGMSRTIGHLTGGTRIEVKKGSLAYVELADPSVLQGRLMWLLPPKVLASKNRR